MLRVYHFITAQIVGPFKESDLRKSYFFQAKIAAAEGAVGLTLYTDPKDYSPEGADFTYPNSWWLPLSGLQRGTLLNLEEGDPLTPGYPSRGKCLAARIVTYQFLKIEPQI